MRFRKYAWLPLHASTEGVIRIPLDGLTRGFDELLLQSLMVGLTDFRKLDPHPRRAFDRIVRLPAVPRNQTTNLDGL